MNEKISNHVLFCLQRPKEFIECVSHIRQLSWLLLGSLTHCALHQGSTSCMPIPLDAGSHIADHLKVILIGFPEQSKVSLKWFSSMWSNFFFVSLSCFLILCFLFLFLSPRRQCCTCALCSTPSCSHSYGLSTASRQLQLRPCRTRTRQSFLLALFSLA